VAIDLRACGRFINIACLNGTIPPCHIRGTCRQLLQLPPWLHCRHCTPRLTCGHIRSLSSQDQCALPDSCSWSLQCSCCAAFGCGTAPPGRLLTPPALLPLPAVDPAPPPLPHHPTCQATLRVSCCRAWGVIVYVVVFSHSAWSLALPPLAAGLVLENGVSEQSARRVVGASASSSDQVH